MAVDLVIGIDSLVLVLAVGLSLTRTWFVPVAAFRPHDQAHIYRATLRLFMLSLIVLWFTSLAWLWVRTAAMSGQPYWSALPIVPKVLFHSHFGTVWWLRVAAMLWASIALAFIAWFGGRISFVSVAAVLFGLAWAAASRSASGHAAADGYWTLRVAMDWLHWVSVSVWGGSLIATTLLIFPRLTQAPADGRAHFALRFSRLSGWALAGVLITGIYNTWHMLPEVSAFWTTLYGRLLGLKLLLVAGMIACGGINRYRLVPELRSSASPDDRAAMYRLRHSVLLETMLLLFVLAVTAALLGSEPPMP